MTTAFIYTMLAMFGFIVGVTYMLNNLDQITKDSLMTGYDIGKRETLRKYNLNEDDLK